MRMKKKYLYCLVCCIIFSVICCGCQFSDASMFYSDIENSGEFLFCKNKLPFTNRSFVCSYHWDGTDEKRKIVIPDTFDGKKVTSLGGFMGRGAPTAFHIVLPDEYEIEYSDERNARPDDNVPIENILFTLYLGENISEFKCVDCKNLLYCKGNDGNTFYIRLEFYIECSENNPYFYSNEGRLYDRNDDSLVKDFFYWDEAVEN